MNKYILSINAGSSSLKFRLYQMPEEQELLSGMFDSINSDQMFFKASMDEKKFKETVGKNDFTFAANYLLNFLKEEGVISSTDDISAVGHRVAHGGEKFDGSVLVDEKVIKEIEELCELAPLHNPANLLCIQVFQKALPAAAQIAVFDTAFHQTMAEDKFLYPLPYKMYEEHGIRKFGFHGISHLYIASKVAERFPEKKDLKVINCHLGNGASICAMVDGKSVDTSMGFTPLAGLMMGTRCGDIDPALPSYLEKATGKSTQEVLSMMNKESGFLGLSKVSNDFRTVHELAEKGDKQAALALKVFVNRVVSTIGAYAATMNGVDVITFTGGIGENSDYLRRAVCENLTYLGVELVDDSSQGGRISTEKSRVVVEIIDTDEELMIARDSYRLAS